MSVHSQITGGTPNRQYDLVLLGATGYTGKLTAQYMVQTMPPNIRWAIAGRSRQKLDTLMESLKSSSKAKPLPDVLTVNLDSSELVSLAKKTKLLLNTIGPYHLYSTPIVQACAENGTHYLDVTGETPWVREVIGKYEDTAKQSGAILIPSIGVESVPSDILAYTATKLIREVWDCGVMDVVGSVHEFKSSGASGGTLASAIGIIDYYPFADIKESFGNPFCLSPISKRDHRQGQYPEPTTYRRSIFQKLTGVWNYPMLGTLTTSITAKPNVSIVHRSSGLRPGFYGYNFTYEEYMRASTFWTGLLMHFAITVMTLLLAIPPFRSLAKRVVTAPGGGPEKEAGKRDVLELRGVALAEQLNKVQRKAFASFRWESGSLYDMTAVTMAEGAYVLLADLDDVKSKFGPGFLTPSCLGDAYVERLRSGGFKIEVKQVGESGSK